MTETFFLTRTPMPGKRNCRPEPRNSAQRWLQGPASSPPIMTISSSVPSSQPAADGRTVSQCISMALWSTTGTRLAGRRSSSFIARTMSSDLKLFRDELLGVWKDGSYQRNPHTTGRSRGTGAIGSFRAGGRRGPLQTRRLRSAANQGEPRSTRRSPRAARSRGQASCECRCRADTRRRRAARGSGRPRHRTMDDRRRQAHAQECRS